MRRRKRRTGGEINLTPLLDVLFSEYCRRDLKSCRMSRERIAAAMEGKHL